MSAPVFDIDDLTTPLTAAEVQASIYAALAVLGIDTTQWASGAVVRTETVTMSLVLAAFTELQALGVRSGFVQFAEGDWLELVAYYVFGYQKQHATFAEGELTLVNGGGGVYSLDPDDLVAKDSATGKEYRNTEAFTLNSGATLTIDVRAIEVGSASNAAATAIDTLTTPLLNVTCSNAIALVAQDDEPDASVRANALMKLGTLSPNGPWDAYTYAAKTAAFFLDGVAGTNVGVTRVKIDKDGFGNVSVYCATPTGGITGTAGDRNTQIGAVDYAVQHDAAPLGIAATVLGATGVTVAITYEAWAYNTSGHTIAEIEALIDAALEAYLSTQPIGGNVIGSPPGKIWADKLKAVIIDALPEIYHVAITVPSGDVTLTSFQVATKGAVTVTGIHLSAPPEGFGAIV